MMKTTSMNKNNITTENSPNSKKPKFLIFGGLEHYGHGGGKDLLLVDYDLHSAIENAELIIGRKAITNKCKEEVLGWDEDECHAIEWTHVLCLKTMDIVYSVGSVYGRDGNGRVEGIK